MTIYNSKITGESYPSIAEGKFHERHQELKHIHETMLLGGNKAFKDISGNCYNAQADFWDEPNGTILEFKCCRLNLIRSKDDEDYCKRDYHNWRGGRWTSNKKALDYCYSNSAYKHAEVGSTLEKARPKLTYAVVFSDDTKLERGHGKKDIQTMRESNFLDKVELNYFYENEFFMFNKNYGEIVDDSDLNDACINANIPIDLNMGKYYGEYSLEKTAETDC